jgi:hypothetical protein
MRPEDITVIWKLPRLLAPMMVLLLLDMAQAKGTWAVATLE